MQTLIEIENQLTELNPGQLSGCMFCEVDEQLIVADTENLWLIRDRYSIVDGHMMVISKDHYGCMGELPKRFFPEIETLRAALPYKALISYEHGRAGHCVKMKDQQVTCHHFHLHFLPLSVDLRSALEPQFNPRKISNLHETPRLFERLGEYLFIETPDGQKLFYPASSHVESHLLRTLVCKAIDKSERADWEAL